MPQPGGVWEVQQPCSVLVIQDSISFIIYGLCFPDCHSVSWRVSACPSRGCVSVCPSRAKGGWLSSDNCFAPFYTDATWMRGGEKRGQLTNAFLFIFKGGGKKTHKASSKAGQHRSQPRWQENLAARGHSCVCLHFSC